MVAEIEKQNLQYWSLNVPTHEELDHLLPKEGLGRVNNLPFLLFSKISQQNPSRPTIFMPHRTQDLGVCGERMVWIDRV